MQSPNIQTATCWGSVWLNTPKKYVENTENTSGGVMTGYLGNVSLNQICPVIVWNSKRSTNSIGKGQSNMWLVIKMVGSWFLQLLPQFHLGPCFMIIILGLPYQSKINYTLCGMRSSAAISAVTMLLASLSLLTSLGSFRFRKCSRCLPFLFRVAWVQHLSNNPEKIFEKKNLPGNSAGDLFGMVSLRDPNSMAKHDRPK